MTMPGSNATGLLLALLTALFWGALPLALKHLLSSVDAISIVCLRFWVAAAWTWGLSCRYPGTARRWAAGKNSFLSWPLRG